MTEQQSAESQNLDISNSAPIQNEPVQEKMVPQSVVTKTVKTEYMKGLEKGKREAQEEWQRQQQQPMSQQPESSYQPSSYASSMGGMPQLTQDQIQRLVEDRVQSLDQQRQKEFQDAQVMQRANQLADAFEQQAVECRTKYPDFEMMEKEIKKQMEQKKTPLASHLILAANEAGITNVADVIYDIWKNNSKLNELDAAFKFSDERGFQKLRELSDSIKLNETARSSPTAPKPLSQVKNSITASDNGDFTSKDWRKQSWLRG